MLDHLHATEGIAELCHGDAPGADRNANVWAVRAGVPVRRFPAFWEGPCGPLCPDDCRHFRDDGTDYCPRAGKYRNQQMLDEFKPNAACFFPGGRGTKDMAFRASIAGVRMFDG